MTHAFKIRNFIILLSISLICSAIGCSKTDPSTLGTNIVCYAAAYNKGVYKSDNGGISWYPLAADQEDIYLYSKKLFMSQDSKRLYITTTGGGLFYIDMGKGVLNSFSGFKDEDVRSVVFVKGSNGQGTGFDIVAGKKETGIFKSIEGTTAWAPLNQGLTYRDVNVLFNGTGSLFAGTVKGVFKWDDNSKSWFDASAGIENRNIFSIAANPDGKTIYAGAGVYQDKKGRFKRISSIYKSMDNGKTWEASGKGLPNDVLIFSIAINPQKPERIYLGTSEGVYRSTDSGKKWSKTDYGLPKEFRVLDVKIAHMSSDKDLVYAAGANGLFVTLDDEKVGWVSRSYGIETTFVSSILLQNN